MKRIGMALLMIVLYNSSSFSIIPVIDESTFTQTTLTAIHTLDSFKKQVEQLAQQAQSYVQDAKAFVALPMSYVDQIGTFYAQYNNALRQAQGVEYTLANARTQFEQVFASATGNAPLLQRAQAMLTQIRAASQAANTATALFERLCAQQASTTALIAASQAAPGSLGAQQATNQLLAVLADQQGSLQQMQATLGRVQVGYIMRQTVAEEQAQQMSQQYLLVPELMPWNQRPSRGFLLPD